MAYQLGLTVFKSTRLGFPVNKGFIVKGCDQNCSQEIKDLRPGRGGAVLASVP